MPFVDQFGNITEGLNYWQTQGNLAAPGDIVELVCPGANAATISFTGTCTNALIEVIGASHQDADYNAPRLIFHSGIGSSGSNKINFTGTYQDEEHRIVAGGYGFRVRLISISSGSLHVRASAQVGVNNVLVTGPVHTTLEEALRASRKFLASTGMIGVQIGESLYVTLTNPVDSGVNLFVYRRWFDNDRVQGDAPLRYSVFVNPTLVLTQTTTGINLDIGQPASSAIVRYQAGASLNLGTPMGSSAPLPLNGVRLDLELLMKIRPGYTLGYRVDGGGNNLTQSANVSVSFVWCEERIA